MNNTKVSGTVVAGALGWKILERITSQGLNFAIQIILARLLLPSDYGQLALIGAVIAYCTVLVQGGLATAIIQKEDLKDKDVSTLLVISLGVALILYLVLFFLAPTISRFYNTESLVWPLRVQSLILFLGAINAIQVALFSRAMNFKAIFFRSILSVPISGCIGILLAFWGFGVWALIAQGLSSLLITIVYMSFNPITHVKFEFSWTSAKELYSFSIKILLAGIFSTFGDSFRTMLIGKRYSPTELGYYNKGYGYSNLVTQVVIMSMSSVLLPTFSKIQKDKEEVLRMARRSISLVAFVIVPVLVSVIGMAEPLVIIILSEKWAPSVPFLMIFCILRIPCCLLNIDKQVYLALGNSSIGLFYELFLVIVNILVILYTSTISVMAIAIGATIVEYIGNSALLFVSRRVYGYKIRDRIKDIWKPVLNSVIMLSGLFVINRMDISYWQKLLVEIPMAIGIYYGCAKITKDNNLPYLVALVKDKIKRK